LSWLPEPVVEARPRRYDPPHVLWYFGAIAAALAASSTIAAVSPSDRGIWQLLVALVLFAGFALFAALLLRAGWWVPGGVLVAAAVTLVPAGGHAFERVIGVWPNVVEEGPAAIDDFQGEVFALALATILVGLVAFAIVPFPFIFAPVAVATFVAAELLVPLLVDGPNADDFAKTTLVTGAAFVLVALVLDSSTRRGEAFWWHVLGLLGVAGGLAWYSIGRDAGWAWIAILVVGAALLVASAPLQRATWTTFGVVGTYAGLFHYIDEWFGSWEAPALMAVIAVGLVLLGIWLQVYERLWTRFGRLPALPPTSPGSPASEPVPPPPVSEPHPPAPPVEETLPDEPAAEDEPPRSGT
jgi:hypothetical protein